MSGRAGKKASNEKAPAKAPVKVSPKAPSKTKTPAKNKKNPQDEDEDEELNLEDYKCPGARLNVITADNLRSWPKTSNCKFYIALEHKNKEFDLNDGHEDKVCLVIALLRILCYTHIFIVHHFYNYHTYMHRLQLNRNR